MVKFFNKIKFNIKFEIKSKLAEIKFSRTRKASKKHYQRRFFEFLSSVKNKDNEQLIEDIKKRFQYRLKYEKQKAEKQTFPSIKGFESELSSIQIKHGFKNKLDISEENMKRIKKEKEIIYAAHDMFKELFYYAKNA